MTPTTVQTSRKEGTARGAIKNKSDEVKDKRAKEQDAFRSLPLPRRRRPWRRGGGWLAVETSGGRERKKNGKRGKRKWFRQLIFSSQSNIKCHFVNLQGFLLIFPPFCSPYCRLATSFLKFVDSFTNMPFLSLFFFILTLYFDKITYVHGFFFNYAKMKRAI